MYIKKGSLIKIEGESTWLEVLEIFDDYVLCYSKATGGFRTPGIVKIVKVK